MTGARRSLAALVRFVAVGGSNTALSVGVYLLVLAAGAPYPAAAAAAFAAGAVNGYVWNRRWTFAAVDSAAARARYLVVQIGGLAANNAVVWLLVEAGAGHVAAYVVSIPPVTVAMFLCNRDWTFRRSRTLPAHG